MTRREYREQVFKYIYSNEFHDRGLSRDQLEILFDAGSCASCDEDDGEILALSDSDKDEIRSRVYEIVEVLPQIDSRLSEISEGWKLSRMSKVDLAILRLAVYEILFDKTSEKVAINEAVELAKKYGTDRSGSFVNGILAKLV